MIDYLHNRSDSELNTSASKQNMEQKSDSLSFFYNTCFGGKYGATQMASTRFIDILDLREYHKEIILSL